MTSESGPLVMPRDPQGHSPEGRSPAVPAKPVGIGIIGAGQIIKRHAQAYAAMPDLARLVAVADLDKRRADKAREAFGFAAAHGDYHELLARDDVHAVSICTPANLHARMVIDAIRAGKHVLCEKPMCVTLAEADAIQEAAEQHPRVKVSFVFQFRFNPAYVRTRRMMEIGMIGRPIFAGVRCRFKKDASYYTKAPGRGAWSVDGGGVLMNQAIHQVDSLVWLFGRPTQVSAAMDTFVHKTETEDTLAGWVRFSSGLIATFDCTVCAHQRESSFDILGENAAMRISGDPDSHETGWVVKSRSGDVARALKKKGQKEVPTPQEPGKGAMAVQKLMAKIKRRPWLPPQHWGHGPCLRAFLLSVLNGTEAPVPPVEARRSLELAMALYQSAMSGAVVTLPLNPESTLYKGFKKDDARQTDRTVPEAVNV